MRIKVNLCEATGNIVGVRNILFPPLFEFLISHLSSNNKFNNILGAPVCRGWDLTLTIFLFI